ncbi:D-alanine--D-serine ligase VanG [Brevibacillus massiliensis]|jgi:D-alanine---D-serine ligase|uniref:D-alanine--D-serine ligase VanG n=1 Tax=Brevibacillus massiliensis TaxID=1118054 RepID=UPI000319995C|nr:D-alanine--D-serine ligase VanG [Brevibacillus massiliensis]
MDKKNIAVLFGGCSNEYEISLSSAAAVLDHLDRDQYNIIMVGITRDGLWLRYSGSVDDIRNDVWHAHPSCSPAFISPSREMRGLVELADSEFHLTKIDVVFPVLHGKNGEDGTIQGLLELSGIPFVGCDTLSSAICMDKEIAHTLVRAAGIATPESFALANGEKIEKAVAAAGRIGYPLYIKPARSGSSFGITKAYNEQELINGVKLARMHDHKVVIEQNIDGFEVGCAILGNAEPIIGEVDEIEIASEFFDTKEKYSLETAAIHLPARIAAVTAAKVKETALLIYKTLGCKGLARVDMFLTRDGQLVFNEVNTMPGFTSKSRYPNMLRSINLSYQEILDRLIQLAAEEDEIAWGR